MTTPAVSVTISANTAQYLQSMLQVLRTTQGVQQQILQLQRAQQQQQSVQQSTASATRSAAGSWTEYASALGLTKQSLTMVKDGLLDIIEVSNAVNFQGANRYALAVRHLNDEITTVKSSIGESLRPAVMAIIKTFSDLLDIVNRFQFRKLANDIVNQVGAALKWLGNAIYEMNVALAQVFVSPFQWMQDTIVRVLAGILDYAGGAVGKIASLLGASGLAKLKDATGIDLSGASDKLAAAAAAARKQGVGLDIGKQFVDGAISARNALLGGLGGALKNTLVEAGSYYEQNYMTKGPAPLKHQFDGIDAAQVKLQQQLTEIATKRAEMNLKDQAAVAIEYQLRNHMDAAQQASRVAMAEEAATIQKNILEEAYSHGSQEQIAAAKEAYGMAIDLARFQRQGTVAQLEQQKYFADLNFKKVDAQFKQAELAARKALDEQEKADRSAAAAGATKKMQAAADVAKVEAEKAVQLADLLREKRLTLEQAAAQIGLTAEQARTVMRKKAADEDAEAAKRAAEEIRRAHEAGLAAFDKVFSGSGVEKMRGAYAETSRSGIGSIKASEQVSIPGMAGGLSVAGFIGVAVELLSQSQQVQALMANLKPIIQALADVVGAVAQPWVQITSILRDVLVPALAAAEPAVAALAALVSPVTMVFQLLVAPLGHLLTAAVRIVSAVMPVVPPLVQMAAIFVLLVSNLWQLAIIAELLAAGLNAIAPYIEQVMNSIFTVWNGLISKLVAWVRSFADLPVIGAIASDLANVLEGLEVPMRNLSSATVQATGALTGLAGQVGNAWSNFLKDRETAMALSAAQRAAEASTDPAVHATADALAVAVAEAWKKATASSDAYDVLRAQQELDAAKAGGFQAGDAAYDYAFEWLSTELAKQALNAAANTTSTDANTKATKELSGSLSNVPAGFKMALARYKANGAQTAQERGDFANAPVFGAGRLGGGASNIGSINITIQVPNTNASPEAIADAVRKTTEQFIFRRTGTLSPQLPGGRFGTRDI